MLRDNLAELIETMTTRAARSTAAPTDSQIKHRIDRFLMP